MPCVRAVYFLARISATELVWTLCVCVVGYFCLGSPGGPKKAVCACVRL